MENINNKIISSVALQSEASSKSELSRSSNNKGGDSVASSLKNSSKAAVLAGAVLEGRSRRGSVWPIRLLTPNQPLIQKQELEVGGLRVVRRNVLGRSTLLLVLQPIAKRVRDLMFK